MKFNLNQLKKNSIPVLKSLKLYDTVAAILDFILLNNQKIRYRLCAKKFYSQFIGKGDLCFDIGANVGNRTAVFLKLGGRVICIEPQEICLQKLNKSYGNNKNVIIVGKAVSDEEGIANLSICKEVPDISTMSEKFKAESRYAGRREWTSIQEVPVTTLDALINKYGLPRFCKIDVEGFEETVLKGLTKPIPYISFEFHKELLDDLKSCITYLLSLGPVEFNCSLGESLKLLFPKWVSPTELYEKLNTLEDELIQGDIYAKFKLITQNNI